MNEGHSARRRTGDVPHAYLVLTAFFTGAAVMTIEVIGSRLIGPVFGVSLYVWTALIAVTLVALAAGYAAGGLIADRVDSADALYRLVLAAGCLTLAVPYVRDPVLAVCAQLGLRAGALTAAALLFGPALLALGCVTPLVARRATRSLTTLGRTVGTLYAVSTLGSVVGTVATGYLLVGWLGTAGVFRLLAAVLLAIGAGYYALFRRRALPVALAVALVASLDAFPETAATARTADGTLAQVVESVESPYGEIRVVDYRSERFHTREMTIEGLVQGGIDVRDGRPVYEYFYVMNNIVDAMSTGNGPILLIGLGPGILPRRLGESGRVVDVVEINPAVVRLARRHFGFRPTGDLFLEDARTYLRRTQRRYDQVILDVFSGDVTPAHVLSREALELTARVLRPGGAILANLVGSVSGDTAGTEAVVATFGAVFAHVGVRATFPPEIGPGYGNLIVVGTGEPIREFQAASTGASAVHPLARSIARNLLGWPIPVHPSSDARPLTDDRNALDLKDGWVREAVRQDIMRTTPLRILTGTVTQAKPELP